MPWRQWVSTPQGWRKAAVTNTIIVSLAAVLLTSLLAVSWTKSGRLRGNVLIYQGGCGQSRVIDITLHLVINIVSSLVLASSNFFIQILSSPTREDVDKAHASKRALEIGSASITTFFRISPFKTVFVVLFLLSSLPFHLFFNGSVFSTSYATADYRLTVASESFPNGAQYFLPGAIAVLPPNTSDGRDIGFTANNSDYLTTWTAKNARSWKKIDVFECVSQYVACYPRVSYRDVVMVVQSTNSSYWFGGNSSLGWSTGSLLAPPPGWNDDSLQFSKSFGFEPPQSASNSLLFSANCSSKYGSSIWTLSLSCQQTCASVVGQYSVVSGGAPITSGQNEYNFSVAQSMLSYINGWTLKAPDAATVELEYCLVEELYPVGLSNLSFTVVVVALILKLGLCISTLMIFHRQKPLVVIGDAIESFIKHPEPLTKGRCTLERSGTRREELSEVSSQLPHPQTWKGRRYKSWLKAIENTDATHPLLDQIPKVFATIGVVVLFILYIIFLAKNAPFTGKHFGQDPGNGSLQAYTSNQLLNVVLLANLPQLGLSVMYLAYNLWYTRLAIEKEWQAYSKEHRPLRVTDPHGQQKSTYRLQLPYKYSLPLLTSSVLVHWLVSNTLYVFITEGGYYTSPENKGMDAAVSGSGFSDDVFIGLGFSDIALVCVGAVEFTMILTSLVMYHRNPNANMVAGGNNSLVISAACHVAAPVSSWQSESESEHEQPYHDTIWPDETGGEYEYDLSAKNQLKRPKRLRFGRNDEDIEMRERLIAYEDEDTSQYNRNTAPDHKATVADITQGLLRWGVVDMPVGFKPDFEFVSEPIGHLAFTTPEQYLGEPVDGKMYM